MTDFLTRIARTALGLTPLAKVVGTRRYGPEMFTEETEVGAIDAPIAARRVVEGGHPGRSRVASRRPIDAKTPALRTTTPPRENSGTPVIPSVAEGPGRRRAANETQRHVEHERPGVIEHEPPPDDHPIRTAVATSMLPREHSSTPVIPSVVEGPGPARAAHETQRHADDERAEPIEDEESPDDHPGHAAVATSPLPREHSSIPVIPTVVEGPGRARAAHETQIHTEHQRAEVVEQEPLPADSGHAAVATARPAHEKNETQIRTEHDLVDRTHTISQIERIERAERSGRTERIDRARPSAPPPVINITIGRIDLRPNTPPPSPTPETPVEQPGPRLSLDEYLGRSR
jgi:hypothetical protein